MPICDFPQVKSCKKIIRSIVVLLILWGVYSFDLGVFFRSWWFIRCGGGFFCNFYSTEKRSSALRASLFLKKGFSSLDVTCESTYSILFKILKFRKIMTLTRSQFQKRDRGFFPVFAGYIVLEPFMLSWIRTSQNFQRLDFLCLQDKDSSALWDSTFCSLLKKVSFNRKIMLDRH